MSSGIPIQIRRSADGIRVLTGILSDSAEPSVRERNIGELPLFTPRYLNNVPQPDHGYQPANRRRRPS
jgi:hypothetical protein